MNVHSRRLFLATVLPLVTLARGRGQEADCDSAALTLTFHATGIDAPPHVSPVVRRESDDIPVARGGQTRFFVSLASELPEHGVQGFILGAGITGNISIIEATLGGTVADVYPEGLAQTSRFEFAGSVDPSHFPPGGSSPQGKGFTGCSVLSLKKYVEIPPVGTANLVSVLVEGPEDEDAQGDIRFQPLTFEGREVEAPLVTVWGDSWYPCLQVGRFVPAPGPTFVRGDIDGSGVMELTDGIYLHGYLFRHDPPSLSCPDAADLNDSGDLDITDGVLVFLHLFSGGRKPALPFPACGPDPTRDDRLSCEAFSPCE
jgi:hypothetical protein